MATATNVSAAAFCPHNGTTHDGTFVCHWTGGPDTRGTLNIFWLCISTLGICVWSAVHPNIPYPGSPWLRRLVDRVGMLLLGLFMPEMLVLKALAELREAMSLLKEVANAGVHTQFPWWTRLLKGSLRKNDVYSEENVGLHSLTHRPFPSPADKPLPISANQTQPDAKNQGRKYSWTLKHSFYAVMGGYYGPDDYFRKVYSQSCDHLLVIKSVVAPLNDPMSIPDVSENDLGDRSKADGLAKLLLIWQLFAFLANCAARWNQGLPLSLLEITTISHCLCSLVALVLWWYKPHSVGEVTIIGEAIVPKTRPGLTWKPVARSVLSGVLGEHVIDVPRTLAMFTIAALYGLPHLLGLSVHFLSPAEELLWRIATFAVIGLQLSLCFILWMFEGGRRSRFYLLKVTWKMWGILIYLFLFLYAASSMFLVGESVRQVFALPEGSFHEPQLARYLPSFS